MASHYDIFIFAINEKRHTRVMVNSYEKGIIERTCIPFDFGPSRRYKDGLDRYHFYDLDSPDGKHNLSILPDQLLNIEFLDIIFDPAEYVTWTPNWFVTRDWGMHS
ncbi:MAG: hypothetical protein JST32_20925 [Bacteroidetes bacterium]|nr:hypothetical protein [Bacteroidota bacterium]